MKLLALLINGSAGPDIDEESDKDDDPGAVSALLSCMATSTHQTGA